MGVRWGLDIGQMGARQGAVRWGRSKGHMRCKGHMRGKGHMRCRRLCLPGRLSTHVQKPASFRFHSHSRGGKPLRDVQGYATSRGHLQRKAGEE